MRFKLRLLWARTGYRPTARLLHRFNLHHTRRIGPMEDGATIHKCEWCGISRVDHTAESLRRKGLDWSAWCAEKERSGAS